MSLIVVVDDDPQVRTLLHDLLVFEGYDVLQADSGAAAQRIVASNCVDLVITDLLMPGVQGLELIVDLREQEPQLPIIAISGGGRIGPDDFLATARFVGADASLSKPFQRIELLAAVSALLVAAGDMQCPRRLANG